MFKYIVIQFFEVFILGIISEVYENTVKIFKFGFAKKWRTIYFSVVLFYICKHSNINEWLYLRKIQLMDNISTFCLFTG